ncbi:MAG: serine--tRNA ligase [Candidatus Aenigmarchaeota archaeon]|nr:serine--tRNA ligase [Candidatus Aenigmarchaeota archaeon]
MLDIKLIRERPEVVLDNLAKRNDPSVVHMLHEFIETDKERRDILQDVEKLRQKRNTITHTVMELKSQGKDASASMKEAVELPGKIKKLDERLVELDALCRKMLLQIPNMLHESVPVGKDDTENTEVKRWGEQHFAFQPKNHLELAEGLGLLDIERAAKIAGHGFYYLKGDLAMLELALQKFAVDFLAKKGYTLIRPPYMMSRAAYEGVTSLADFEDVLYKIEGEDLHLIATSEHPMAAMYMDETIPADKLPIRLIGISACFRKEVGAHGKYTRGLFRTHHFNKIEQFVFCLPEDSWKIHEELQKNSEELYQALGIPYRVVNVCTGDIGIIAAKKYDTEFLMADGQYREIGSNSNCTDYQARRLNVKYREAEGKPPAGFVHTLNNTALAMSRTPVAIIENYQQEDGTITVPKALQPYMNGVKVIGPSNTF